MEPGGYTIRAIQNLRLVHAMVRYRINRKKANPDYPDNSIAFPWNDEWGAPINQQDMLFAIHTFSVEVLDGLKTHGVRLHPRRIDDYYRTWHLFGKALGLHDDLNPETYEEGRLVQERIYEKEFKKNDNGLQLTPPLIKFAQQFLPFSPSDTHIYAMVKAYNDKKDFEPVFQEILGLPLNKAHIGWLALYFVLDELMHILTSAKYIFTPPSKRPEYVHRVAHHNQRMIQALVNINKTWTGRHFRIADGFGEAASEIDAMKVDTQPSFIERLGKVFK